MYRAIYYTWICIVFNFHHYLTFSEIEMLQAHKIFHDKWLHILMIKLGENGTSISKILAIPIVVQCCANVLGLTQSWTDCNETYMWSSTTLSATCYLIFQTGNSEVVYMYSKSHKLIWMLDFSLWFCCKVVIVCFRNQ